MATLEEIFYKEFNGMMQQLKVNNGILNINEVPMPPEASSYFKMEKHDIVAIQGINDEYYSKLNNTESLLWNSGQLKRRRFDYKGEFMKDKDGHQLYDDVTLPHECVAVISDVKLGVPLKYKPSEPFEYVDMVSNKDGLVKYVYIVPRKYCYKVTQVALVLSLNKMRVYWDGIAIALKNGNVVYLYTIPYKPSTQMHNYRILHTKTSSDFSKELIMIRDYWLSIGYMFDPQKCTMLEAPKGRENMALQIQPSVLEEYIRFDTSKPLGVADEEFDIDENEEF